MVKRHFSSNSSTFQTEVKLEYDSSTVSSTSSTSSTTSTTSTTPLPSTKINDHDPEAQTTKIKAPKVVNGTVELETIEELCRELSRGAAPTYPPLPTIEHHLPYHTVNHIGRCYNIFTFNSLIRSFREIKIILFLVAELTIAPTEFRFAFTVFEAQLI